jgi:HD superfamily phosphohydrolase
MNAAAITYLDALYGDVSFGPEISELIHEPIVQRLRHVRLSNIDSIAMPGIANISRYEHVLGVAHLATQIGVRRKLPAFDHLALVAAALLHDWAITAFGHLVEEAFNYAGVNFHHENRLNIVLRGRAGGDTLGVDLQILEGRQAKLSDWARKMAGPTDEDQLLHLIEESIRGTGKLGGLIAGTMDLDNMDNVYRMAFHMGLEIDRKLPLRLAAGIVDTNEQGLPVFARSATRDVEAWVATRREVYRRLMPAQPDFSYKIMIIWAAAKAIEENDITPEDWILTDVDFLVRLASSKNTEVRQTIARWRAGEAWDTTPLWWLPGRRPKYSELVEFSDELTRAIGRPCVAYAIKDKRERKLDFQFDDGSSATFGSDPSAWLLGVGSSKRAAFSRVEAATVLNLATARFAPAAQAIAVVDPIGAAEEACLL